MARSTLNLSIEFEAELPSIRTMEKKIGATIRLAHLQSLWSSLTHDYGLLAIIFHSHPAENTYFRDFMHDMQTTRRNDKSTYIFEIE